VADKTDSKRLVDLEAALKALGRKKAPLISLDECAALWGVTKPRFVTKRKEMAGFPDMAERDGNAHLYPAREALKAMISFIQRHQTANAAKTKRLGQLIGTDQMSEQMVGNFSIAELAKANQLAAEIEQRMRDQGLYVRVDELQRVVGMVFSEVSETLSNLSNLVDPHGRLEPETRTLIDTNAHELLLRTHKNLKGMLSPDAVDTGNRKPARKPRKAPARRKRSGSGSRKA